MDWANIINAIGVIIVAYFTYNQYTKNKITDYKLEKWKEEDKVKNKRRIDNSMIVFGELWDLLYNLKADRVYIIQPYPLGHEETLSIYFEVKRKWAEPMKPHIQKMRICEVAKFASVGTVCFAVAYFELIFLTECGVMKYITASALSYTISVVLNYILSMKFVFRAKEELSKAGQFIIFVLLSVIGLGLTQLTMVILVEQFHIFYAIAKVLASMIVTTYNFVSKKIFLDES